MPENVIGVAAYKRRREDLAQTHAEELLTCVEGVLKVILVFEERGVDRFTTLDVIRQECEIALEPIRREAA